MLILHYSPNDVLLLGGKHRHREPLRSNDSAVVTDLTEMTHSRTCQIFTSFPEQCCDTSLGHLPANCYISGGFFQADDEVLNIFVSLLL